MALRLMQPTDQTLSNYSSATAFGKWASFSFGCYLLTIYFGTSLPFQEASPDTGDANIVNQLLALLYVVSFVSLWGKLDEVLGLIRKEKFLSLLMLWHLLMNTSSSVMTNLWLCTTRT